MDGKIEMGTILQLSALPRSAKPATEQAAAVPCEIIIFPGVRIERDDDLARNIVFDPTGHGGANSHGRPRKSS